MAGGAEAPVADVIIAGRACTIRLPQDAPVSWQTMRKRRLGVMGGTFDPIHNGHLVAASEVASLFDLDEVVFVPSGQPWQKKRQVSAGEDRYLMTVIATAANPRFSVSRVDIDRGGLTYTKDTLRDLQALNPDSDLYFITGADALAAILSWQDLDQLFAVARFVGVSRPGYELAREHLADVLDGLPDDALTLVEIPALAISSTDCRRRAEEGRPLWYLMPDGVVQYISKRELYRKPGDDT
jgi:nicotinate-nucleotide adenylyltransferase